LSAVGQKQTNGGKISCGRGRGQWRKKEKNAKCAGTRGVRRAAAGLSGWSS